MSLEVNARQYPQNDESVDKYFDLNNENDDVVELVNTFKATKLSGESSKILEEQTNKSNFSCYSMFEDKTNAHNRHGTNTDKPVLPNICTSYEDWIRKVPRKTLETEPTRFRLKVAKAKKYTYEQNSPSRSPLAKRMCPTNERKQEFDQHSLFHESCSSSAVSNAVQLQEQIGLIKEEADCDGDRVEPIGQNPVESTEDDGRLCLAAKTRMLLSNTVSLSSLHHDGSIRLADSRSRSTTDLNKCVNIVKTNLVQSLAERHDGKITNHAGKGYKTGTSNQKSSEELEVEKMEALRKDLEQKRKISQASYLKALAGPVTNPGEIHSGRGPTIPMAFHFTTDNRMKEHPKENTGMAYQEKDFAMILRKSDPALEKMRPKLTVVQPFKLELEKKRKRVDDNPVKPKGYKFQTMGEKLYQFSVKTPERFRARKTQSMGPGLPYALKITVAKTPNLATKMLRKRHSNVISQAQKEEMEIEEMKRLQFKAQPLNKKILEEPDNLKPVQAKQSTVIEPFKLTKTEHRSEENLASATHFEFHAHPVPKAIYKPEIYVPRDPKITVPESPAFTWKKNCKVTRSSESVLPKLEDCIIKAPPVPNFDEPFQPVLPHRRTEPKPFSFDERIKKAVIKKEKAIEMVLKEEAKAREFVANPIVDLSPNLPKKKVIPCTAPVPFKFTVDERGAEKKKKLEGKLEEEEQRAHAAALFHAQPATVLSKVPFAPQKIEHASVEPVPFRLQTEERSNQHMEWKMWKKQKDEVEELERQEMERKRLEEEEAEVQKLRREAVHQAKPIRRYKPVERKESIPLTAPKSPNFSERLKPRN